MFGQPFSHDELQKYIAIFGTLFNNIVIAREIDGAKGQSFKVPVAFGPREKALARTESDPELNRPYSELLPRMAFEITGMKYDGDRKRATTAKWSARRVRGEKRVSYDFMYSPVPYDIDFRLSILANKNSDAFRIVTSILPFFRPDITVTANILPEFPDYELDIPIVYKGISHEDNYEEKFEKRRVIEYKLDFTMKAEIFGPITEAKVIKVAKVNLYADSKGEYHVNPDERIQIQPGLTIDGRPTDVKEESIPVFQIDEDDDYGYVTTITTGPIVE